MGVANQLDGSCNPAGNWKGNHLVGMMVGRCTTMGKLRQEFNRLTSLNGVRMREIFGGDMSKNLKRIHKSWGFQQQHKTKVFATKLGSLGSRCWQKLSPEFYQVRMSPPQGKPQAHHGLAKFK